MSPTVAKRVKVGDVVEIATKKGLAYALYTHRDPQWGALLRVTDGLFETTPADLNAVVKRPLLFSAFFPLQQAVNQGIVSVVGTVPVPDDLSEFPTFRSGPIDPVTKKVSSWWLWDGREQWQVQALSSVQRTFPLREIVNDTLLIQRIENGWKPEIES